MIRVSAAVVLGAIAAGLTGLQRQEWHYSPAVGWIVAAAVYLVSTWWLVLPMDADKTVAHVRQRHEDGTPGSSHLIVLIASVASLGGVGYLLAAASGAGAHLGEALVGIFSVVAAWFAIHTTFMLRYAQLYFRSGRGGTVTFHEDNYRPCYADFAYLAFTIGMTYQVSDTDLTSRQMRSSALGHALVSFLLGAVVLASTINLVLELAGH